MEISNTDQLSLINTSIDVALRKQSQNFMQYIDSRLSQVPQPTAVKVDDFSFTREGNKVQFKFNSERSAKLSEILNCIENRNLSSAENIIRSELGEYKERNKIIKIGDRHGWDVVKEYTILPLADDNDDAAKLRAAINRATRKRFFTKPYDRNVQQNSGRQNYFRRQPAATFQRPAPQQPTFQPGSCFECHLPGHFARQCPYKNRQFQPRKPPSATITGPVDTPQSSQ